VTQRGVVEGAESAAASLGPTVAMAPINLSPLRLLNIDQSGIAHLRASSPAASPTAADGMSTPSSPNSMTSTTSPSPSGVHRNGGGRRGPKR